MSDDGPNLPQVATLQYCIIENYRLNIENVEFNLVNIGEVHIPNNRLKNKKYYHFEQAIDAYQKLDRHFNTLATQQEYIRFHQAQQNARKNLEFSMLEIYDDLNDLDAYCLHSVVEKLYILAVQQRQLCYRSTRHKNQESVLSLDNSPLCIICSEHKQKNRISKIMKDFQLRLEKQLTNSTSQVDHKLKNNNAGEDEDTLQQRLHIKRIQQILSSQTKTLILNKKETSITKQYLLKETHKFLDDETIDLSELVNTTRENFKMFKQATSNGNKGLVDNLIQIFSGLIKYILKPGFKKIIGRHMERIKSNLTENETQTEEFDLMMNIKSLQKSIQSKQRLIQRLRQSKKESEQSVIKLINEQQQVKIKNLEYKSKCLVLEDKINRMESQIRQKETKNLNEMIFKEREIEALKKKIQELRKDQYQKQILVKKMTRKSIKRSSNQTQKSRYSTSKQASNTQLSSQLNGIYDIKFKERNSKTNQPIKLTSKARNPRTSCFCEQPPDHSIETNQNGKEVQSDQFQKELQRQNNEDTLLNIENLDEDSCQINSIQSEENKCCLQNNTNYQISNQYSLAIDAQNHKKPIDHCVYPLIAKLSDQNYCSKQPKSRIGYRIFKPSQVHALKDERRKAPILNETEPGHQKNFKNWPKFSDILRDNRDKWISSFGFDRLKTEGNQNFRKESRSKIDRLNTSKITIEQIKDKIKGNYMKKDQVFIETSERLHHLTTHHLYVFGGEKQAREFQRKTGVWPALETANKLVLDFENNFIAGEIQKYFNHLESTDFMRYAQYANFLHQPISYLNKAKGDSDLKLTELPKNKIKQIFSQLIKFHRMYHNNCSHIVDFLRDIGFQQLQLFSS